jgi:hypothetical protein
MMKKLLGISLILGATPLVASEDDWSLNNHVMFWGDWVRLKRQGSQHQRLIIDEGTTVSSSCGNCVAGTACNQGHIDKNFDYKDGYRVGVNCMTRRTVLEASYLWVEAWHAHCSATDSQALYFSESHANEYTDFSNADHAGAHWESRLQTGELNYFHYSTPRREDYFSASWMVGLRYFYIPENFELTFENAGSKSSYRTSATNHIYGIQAGGTIEWNATRTLTWDLIGKIGVGWDFAHNHVFQGDNNNFTILRDYSAEKNAFPFTLDTLLTVVWQPWNWLNLHVGGEFLYLNAIASAPAQITKHLTHEHHIRTNAQIYYYGIFAGIGIGF